MKNIKKLIVILVMALAFTGICLPQSSMSYASATSNVNKMLNAYKNHHYVTANKYAKKLKSTRDASEKRMTSSMKKAFNKTLSKYNTSRTWAVYFADMDGDNKAEMLVVYGSCVADLHTYIYKYKNGKSVYVGRFSCFHLEFVNYPGHRGVILHYTDRNFEGVSTVCLRNGKIKTTNYGSRNITLGDYLDLTPLYSHM